MTQPDNIYSNATRHPRLRAGEREPIDPYTRRLIYRRDGYSCGWCGRHLEPDSETPSYVLQLDHLVPWSAYGSDRSDNLRTLCRWCNEDRSNYVDLVPPRLIGVTRACYWCAKRRRQLPDQLTGIPPDELDHINAYCGSCDATSWVPAEEWIL